LPIRPDLQLQWQHLFNHAPTRLAVFLALNWFTSLCPQTGRNPLANGKLDRYSQAGTILILSSSRQVAVAKIDQLFNKNNHQIDVIPPNGLLWLRALGVFSRPIQFGWFIP
jgi:hypothetical protein